MTVSGRFSWALFALFASTTGFACTASKAGPAPDESPADPGDQGGDQEADPDSEETPPDSTMQAIPTATAGTLDPAFGSAGFISGSGGNQQTFAYGASGLLVIEGSTLAAPLTITRYRPNGSVDTTYGQSGVATITLPGGPFISYFSA